MRRGLALVTMVTLAASLATPAFGEPSSLDVRVVLGREARLVDGGQAVVLTVRVRCSAGAEVLEAFAYAVQDGVQGDFGFMPLECDGTGNLYRVTSAAFDGMEFHEGMGNASAYVLIEDPVTGDTLSGQDARRILIGSG